MRIAVHIGMVLAVIAATACGKIEPKQQGGKTAAEREAEQAAAIKRACASETTYQRLKEYAFDEARRIAGGRMARLDAIAAGSQVRMEHPLVKSRDDKLNVTVCTGELVLELPPGMADAFKGQQRLTADVEYSAQAAADGSGLVYRMEGAEPIIYGLAAFELPGQGGTVPTQSAQPTMPTPVPRAVPPGPAAAPAPPAPPPVAVTRPSFNCRRARKHVEQMICADPRLAAWDRQMSSTYYAALANTRGDARRALRRSRDDFLDYRNACTHPGCVVAAYRDRIRQIEEIARE